MSKTAPSKQLTCCLLQAALRLCLTQGVELPAALLVRAAPHPCLCMFTPLFLLKTWREDVWVPCRIPSTQHCDWHAMAAPIRLRTCGCLGLHDIVCVWLGQSRQLGSEEVRPLL